MKNVSVFCGASYPKEKKDFFYGIAYETGKQLAEAGFVTITGAGPGLMEEVLRGASENGGNTIGVSLNLPGRVQSKYASQNYGFDKLGPRQDKLIQLGEAYIALPGGVGTLYEILNVIALKRVNEIPPERPLILVCQYYSSLNDMIKEVVKAGFVEEEALNYFTLVDTPKEAAAALKQ
jgi:uncharacterized protein (TIGR00730 family)